MDVRVLSVGASDLHSGHVKLDTNSTLFQSAYQSTAIFSLQEAVSHNRQKNCMTAASGGSDDPLRRWIHHGADHEDAGTSRAASGNQEPGRATDPAPGSHSDPQSMQAFGMMAAHPASRAEPPQQAAELCTDLEAPAISSMPENTVRQGQAGISTRNSMQRNADLLSASAAADRTAQGHGSEAGEAAGPLSEADCISGGLDDSIAAELCALLQEASVLVGMHPDQVLCRQTANDVLMTPTASSDAPLQC